MKLAKEGKEYLADMQSFINQRKYSSKDIVDYLNTKVIPILNDYIELSNYYKGEKFLNFEEIERKILILSDDGQPAFVIDTFPLTETLEVIYITDSGVIREYWKFEKNKYREIKY